MSFLGRKHLTVAAFLHISEVFQSGLWLPGTWYLWIGLCVWLHSLASVTSFPISSAEEQLLCMMIPPPCFTAEMALTATGDDWSSTQKQFCFCLSWQSDTFPASVHAWLSSFPTNWLGAGKVFVVLFCRGQRKLWYSGCWALVSSPAKSLWAWSLSWSDSWLYKPFPCFQVAVLLETFKYLHTALYPCSELPEFKTPCFHWHVTVDFNVHRSVLSIQSCLPHFRGY